MTTIDISAGRLDYLDTGGDGPALVLTHGFPIPERSGARWFRC